MFQDVELIQKRETDDMCKDILERPFNIDFSFFVSEICQISEFLRLCHKFQSTISEYSFFFL